MKLNYNILIIGYGTVGKATYDLLKYNNENVEVDIYDTGIEKYNILNKDKKYDVSFICINLPNNGLGDEFNVLKNIIDTFKVDYFFLRTTVIPNTLQKLKKDKNNVFSMPEYLREKTGFDPKLPIIISDDVRSDLLVEHVENLFPKSKTEWFESDICELSKMVQNLYFAYKITFFNAVKEMCDSLAVDYNDLKDCMLATASVTGTISETGMIVPCNGEYGFGGKCLPKDVINFNNFAQLNNLNLIEGITAYVHNSNLKFRDKNESINTSSMP